MKLPKAETLILLAFLVCMALWAASKCNERRAGSARRVREIEGTEEERPVKRDTVLVQAAPQKPAANEVREDPAIPPVNQTAAPPAAAPKLGAPPKRPTLSNDAVKPAPQTTVTNTEGSVLYVSIDGLKVRKEPGLKSETLAELKLYEPVTFLNKKTEWTQEISLGYEKVTDHWVKVRTQSGKEGWVFGAGVHYYKMKRQGVMDLKKPVDSAPKKKN